MNCTRFYVWNIGLVTNCFGINYALAYLLHKFGKWNVINSELHQQGEAWRRLRGYSSIVPYLCYNTYLYVVTCSVRYLVDRCGSDIKHDSHSDCDLCACVVWALRLTVRGRACRVKWLLSPSVECLQTAALPASSAERWPRGQCGQRETTWYRGTECLMWDNTVSVSSVVEVREHWTTSKLFDDDSDGVLMNNEKHIIIISFMAEIRQTNRQSINRIRSSSSNCLFAWKVIDDKSI